MKIKWIQGIHVEVRGEDNFYEARRFEGEGCMTELLEYLCSLGLYSSITLEQKIEAKDIVMKRLKGE